MIDKHDAIPALVTVTLGIFSIAFVVSLTTCEYKSRRLVASAIADGRDPILSACAINGAGMSAVCVARVSQVQISDESNSTSISDSTFTMQEGSKGPAIQLGE